MECLTVKDGVLTHMLVAEVAHFAAKMTCSAASGGVAGSTDRSIVGVVVA